MSNPITTIATAISVTGLALTGIGLVTDSAGAADPVTPIETPDVRPALAPNRSAGERPMVRPLNGAVLDADVTDAEAQACFDGGGNYRFANGCVPTNVQ